MKALIVTPEFPPQFGGIGTHCHEMAKHWSRLVDLTVLAPEGVGKGPHGASFRVIRLHSAANRAVRLWRVARQLRRLLAAGSFDFVYVAHWRTSGVALRLANIGRGFAPRYVQAIHGGEVLYLLRSRKDTLSRLLFQWTTSSADAFVALGQNQAGLLDRLGIESGRVFVSPEGVDISAFQAPDSPEALRDLRRRHNLEGRRVLLTVARLAPHKGHDMVIRAMPEVLARVPDAAYLIVGSGSRERALRRLAEEFGVSDRVHFAEFVPDHELAAHYYLCDVFVMPSREVDGDTEGFGIVFAEAAACGKPTIGGRTGGILEAIQDGKTGVLVDPTSPTQIADAAVLLLTDQELARRMGEAGKRRVVDELQYAQIAANILAICQPTGTRVLPGTAA